MSRLNTLKKKIKLSIMCKITSSLKAILDPDNVEDKKILLLAELIEDMRDSLYKKDEALSQDISAIKEDISVLKNKVSAFDQLEDKCPILQSEDKFTLMKFIIEYPKVTMAIVLLVGLLLGVTSDPIFQFVVKIIQAAF